MPAPILYLAQAYSKYPIPSPYDEFVLEHEAYKLAQQTVKRLWELGFEVFSPIAYTHPLHIAWGLPQINYVAYDLALLARWCVPLPYCGTEEQGYARGSGYHDGCMGCSFWYQNRAESETHMADHKDPSRCKLKEWRQPNVVMVFAEDCLSIECKLDECVEPTRLDCDKYCSHSKWFVDASKSRGAKAEFDFAIKNHIQCVRLEEVLAIASSQEHCKETVHLAALLKAIYETELG